MKIFDEETFGPVAFIIAARDTPDNTPCIGAEVQHPFGGMKASGNGHREGSHRMLDIYTEWKTIAIQREERYSIE